MGTIEGLSYPIQVVIALDEFGEEVGREAQRQIQALEAALRPGRATDPGKDPTGVAIKWVRAVRENGEWCGRSFDHAESPRTLIASLAQAFETVPDRSEDEVDQPGLPESSCASFLVGRLETPDEAASFIQVGRRCREYLSNCPWLTSSLVYGVIYAPLPWKAETAAVVRNRSLAFRQIAATLSGDEPPGDHIFVFEDLDTTAEALKARLADVLYLLLTSKPLAEHFQRVVQQDGFRQRGQFFSTLGTSSLIFPVATLAEEAKVSLARKYLACWVLPEEQTPEDHAVRRRALAEIAELLDTRRWQEQILQRLGGKLPASLIDAGSEPCLELDVHALFGGGRLEQIRERLAPADDPRQWASRLEEIDADLSTWLRPRLETAVREVIEGREGSSAEGLRAQVDRQMQTSVDALSCRPDGPPCSFAAAHDFLNEIQTHVHGQRGNLANHVHPDVDLVHKHRRLEEATQGLPFRETLYARRLTGTVVALVFAFAALLVAGLHPCHSGVPTAFWLPPPYWPGFASAGGGTGLGNAGVCAPHRDLVVSTLALISASALAITWLGLWLWHQRLIINARIAWEQYWEAVGRKHSYLLHDTIVVPLLVILQHLEQETIPALQKTLDDLEQALHHTLEQHLVAAEQLVDPSPWTPSLVDGALCAELYKAYLYAPSEEATLRFLAAGDDLFPHGLHTTAQAVWHQLCEVKSRECAEERLLRLTAGQILGRHSGSSLRHVLRRLPEDQHDYDHLLGYLYRLATPRSSLHDAREGPDRVGRLHTFLLSADTHRLTALRELSPEMQVAAVADPFRISVVRIVEPFSARALSSVLPESEKMPA